MRLFSGLPPYLAEDSNDLRLYREAGEAILRGEVPYRDFFVEYPPGSLPAFVPPALLSETSARYQTLFAFEMALVLIASLVLTALAARRLGGFRAWPVPALTFAAGALMLYPVAIARYDAVVAFTLAAAAFCVTLGARYTVPAYLFLGLGTVVKLIPALATAPLALLRSENSGPLRRAIYGFLAFFAVVALFFVPAYALGGAGYLESFAYHADRGLQLESVGASVLLNLGWIEDVLFEYGAFEVRGRGVELALSLSLPVTAALLLVTALAAYRERRRGRLVPATFSRYAAAFILAFMLGSKVLSPQYLIWLLPLMPLSFGGLAGVAVCTLFLAACLSTTQVFPVHYDDLFTGSSPGTELLLLRNALLLVLWTLMLLPSYLGREKA